MIRDRSYNKDFTSVENFPGPRLWGYYNNCDFSGCDFSGTRIEAVAIGCRFDGADLSEADICRLFSRGSSWTGAQFPKGDGCLALRHNHEIIAELLRQYAEEHLSGSFKRTCLKTIQAIRDSKLSWDRLTATASVREDEVITMGFHVFKDYPPLYQKMVEFKSELEPDELKIARSLPR